MKNNTTILRDGTQHKRIINGCWQFSSGHNDAQLSPIDTLSEYIKQGFTTFDGADIYTGVEEIFGKLTNIFQGDNLRFHTKHVPDLNDIQNGLITRESTIQQIFTSIEKMSTDTIDNLQFHWWDYDLSGYKTSIKTLLELQNNGTIMHIGITNTNVDFLLKLEQELDFIPMTTQNQYSIIDRRPEYKLIPHALERNIGLYGYGSLMGGLLSDRYLGLDQPQEPVENRSLRKYLQVIHDWGDWELFQELLQELHKIGVKYSATISEISASWVLHQKGVNSVILGVRNKGHLGSNHKILQIHLDSRDMEIIDHIYSKGKPLEGDVFDLERYESRHHDIMRFNLNKGKNKE